MSLTQLRLREMNPSDWGCVSKIYAQALREGTATFETVCPSYEVWNAAHLAYGRIVACRDDIICGWCALSAVSKRQCYRGVAEVSIYVDTEYRNMGIGYTLLMELCKASEKHGIWTLQATVIKDNTASALIHEKAGFRVVGYREGIATDVFGKWKDTVLLERRSKVL